MSTVAGSARAVAPGRYRDPFIDVLRVAAIAVVVCGHWIMPVLSRTGGTVSVGTVLTTPGWWLLTWPLQVMPVFFFAGGAANHHSFEAHTSTREWLAARVSRLALPVLPLLAVWLVLPSVLQEFGVPSQAVTLAAGTVGQLLWFLAVYVGVVALVPLAHIAHRRWGLAVPVVLGVAALGVDALRWHGVPLVGYLNEILVWAAMSQLGIAYADGTLSRRNALPLAGFGFGATILLVLFGHYPASMVGLPGQVSNMAPATVCLLCLGVGQIGVLLALREKIVRWTPPAWLGARCMTFYLWHMTALLIVTGVAVLGFGYATPAPDSVQWLALTPLWIIANGLVLALLVRLFGRFEAIRMRAQVPSAWRLTASVVLLCAGFTGICRFGFAAAPIAALFTITVVAGIVLALPGAVAELGMRCLVALVAALRWPRD